MKRFRMHQKAPKSTKSTKITKAQKRNRAKAQRRKISEQKFKHCLKNIQREKGNLFAYLSFCGFCARDVKKLEKRR